jgi:hypothetical protein
VYVTDLSSNVATSVSSGVDLYTLHGIGLNDLSINYGTMELLEDTGAENQSVEVQNSGNVAVDIQVEGTDMVNGGSSIPVGNQQYSSTTFTYGSCAICPFLSGTASNLELDLPKPTSTTTPSTDEVYWGLYIPLGTEAVPHTGQNIFYATAD